MYSEIISMVPDFFLTQVILSIVIIQIISITINHKITIA